MFNSDNHDWISENPDAIYIMSTYVNEIYQRNMILQCFPVWVYDHPLLGDEANGLLNVFRSIVPGKREREGERADMATKPWLISIVNICTYVYSLFVCIISKCVRRICKNSQTTSVPIHSNNSCTCQVTMIVRRVQRTSHSCSLEKSQKISFQSLWIPDSKDKHLPFRCPFSHEIVCFKEFYDPESIFVTNFSKYTRILTGCV